MLQDEIFNYLEFGGDDSWMEYFEVQLSSPKEFCQGPDLNPPPPSPRLFWLCERKLQSRFINKEEVALLR